jgi:hypothetical protein
LIQVTEDGGKTWRKVELFPGVPERTYVSRVLASRHDANSVYAAFDNHKSADFAPHLVKSTDAGKTWAKIAGDLPPRGSVLSLAEDHVDPKLLFGGTEFGLYFSVDGGTKWHRLKSGLPTVAVRDLCVQRAMNDLVVATFGRGFYVLDDYSPLRSATPEALAKPAALFPVRDGFLYMPVSQYGGRGKGFQGEAFYAADNPPFGATITYHLKDALLTAKKRRQKAQKKDENAPYPSPDRLRAEAEEETPAVLLTVNDAAGTPVRVLTGPTTAGVHRVTWDLRAPAVDLPRPQRSRGEVDEDVFPTGPTGPYVPPGKYTVSLAQRVNGEVKPLAGPVEFTVRFVGPSPLPADDLKQLVEFQQQVIKLQRDLTAAQGTAGELTNRLEQIKVALDETPAAPPESCRRVRALITEHRETVRRLSGDAVLRERNENVPTSIAERVAVAAGAARALVARPTGTQREQYTIARRELDEVSAAERKLAETGVKELEAVLTRIGAPWTPGRLPGGGK